MTTQLQSYQNQHVVARYAKENKLSLETAQVHFEECKKFLYLCSISDVALSPSERIDKVWHEFIMFTRDYQNFCKDVLGSFIHHVPDIEHNATIRKQNKESFEYARTLAQATFGEIDPYMWCLDMKEVEAADCTGCSGLDGNCTGCRSTQA